MSDNERPASAVPLWVMLLLGLSLVAQISLHAGRESRSAGAENLPLPPRSTTLRVAALGEPAALSRVAMLYIQSFDYHGANSLPYRSLDYDRLIRWLREIQALDPSSTYPLFAASRVYAEVRDPERQRKMLNFVYEEFAADPNRRWASLAHAALIAKHRLRDLPLALKFARAVDRHATSSDVPLWARQMEVFILEDMNELEAARIMLGGLLAKGLVRDHTERKYMEARLKAMEERVRIQTRPRDGK